MLVNIKEIMYKSFTSVNLEKLNLGFEIRVLPSQRVLPSFFSIIIMLKKSHFTIFMIQNVVQNTNVFVFIILFLP